jgi:hypothetical protein
MEVIIRPILFGVTSLLEHIFHVDEYPENYHPDRCPYCGTTKLRPHGSYYRVPDRDSSTLNPVEILRFRCLHHECGRTCSCLPECIAPHRWYPWKEQQEVLSELLKGGSIRQIAAQTLPSRRTVSRWWSWLQKRHKGFNFHLLKMGRSTTTKTSQTFEHLWSIVLQQQTLAFVMGCLIIDGVAIP